MVSKLNSNLNIYHCCLSNGWFLSIFSKIQLRIYNIFYFVKLIDGIILLVNVPKVFFIIFFKVLIAYTLVSSSAIFLNIFQFMLLGVFY